MPEIIDISEGIADTVNTAGSVAAPAANASVCSIAAGSLPAGVYQVRIRVTQGPAGTLAAADVGNFRFTKGGASQFPPNGMPSNCEIVINRMTLDGSTSLAVNSGGNAATAATVYGAALSATRIQ